MPAEELPRCPARRHALLLLRKEGFRSGQSEDEIHKSLDFSIWDKLERSYVIGRNINRAYLETETDSFTNDAGPMSWGIGTQARPGRDRPRGVQLSPDESARSRSMSPS
jgi:hypothetical protein